MGQRKRSDLPPPPRDYATEILAAVGRLQTSVVVSHHPSDPIYSVFTGSSRVNTFMVTGALMAAGFDLVSIEKRYDSEMRISWNVHVLPSRALQESKPRKSGVHESRLRRQAP